jgi:hypothetical protein
MRSESRRKLCFPIPVTTILRWRATPLQMWLGGGALPGSLSIKWNTESFEWRLSPVGHSNEESMPEAEPYFIGFPWAWRIGVRHSLVLAPYQRRLGNCVSDGCVERNPLPNPGGGSNGGSEVATRARCRLPVYHIASTSRKPHVPSLLHQARRCRVVPRCPPCARRGCSRGAGGAAGGTCWPSAPGAPLRCIS